MKKYIIILLNVLLPYLVFSQISTNEIPPSFNKMSVSKDTTVKLSKKFSKPDLSSVKLQDIQDSISDLPPRFAVPIEVNLSLADSSGWTMFDKDTKVWRAQFTVPEAKALTVVYDKFWLPKGGKLYIYSADKKQHMGAFTDINNKGSKNSPSGFVTGFVKGNSIIIEYYEPIHSKEKGIISIQKLGYVYKNIPFMNLNSFGDSKACNVNVNCPAGQNWQKEKRSVALIADMFGFRLCSGALINNTLKDRSALFLTADHCLPSGVDAEGDNDLWYWLFYWNYESPGCSNGVDFIPPSSLGAVLLANNDHTDFALLKLTDSLYNINGYIPYFLGWSRNSTSAQNGTGIHHPKGDIKKISVDYNTINNYPYQIPWKNSPPSEANTHWKAVFDIGTTEGGSSGSPLMDQYHRVIGQLHGGDSGCPPITKYYGKFNVSWNYGSTMTRRLKDWLDPVNVNAQTLNGMGMYDNVIIPGLPSICNQAVTFYIENLPPNATVTWSKHPDIDVISQTNNSITVKRSILLSLKTDGWIKADLGPPYNFTVPKDNIIIWKPGISQTETLITGNLYSWGGEVEIPNELLNYGATNVKWKASANWTASMQGASFTQFYGDDIEEDEVIISVEMINPCGESTSIYRVFQIIGSNYSAYFEPSSNSFIIKPKFQGISTKETPHVDMPMFDRIEIVDEKEDMKLEMTVFKTNNYQIDVNHLPHGVYYLQLYSNNKLIDKKRIEIGVNTN